MSSTHSHSPKGISSSSNEGNNATTGNSEQSGKENEDVLRHALTTSRAENDLLNEVISTIGSTLNLDEVLRHLVDILVRAVSAMPRSSISIIKRKIVLCWLVPANSINTWSARSRWPLAKESLAGLR